LCFGKTDSDVLENYLGGLNALPGWLGRLDIDLVDRTASVAPCWPNLPGADGVVYYAVPGELGPGPELWRGLESAMRTRAVRVLTETRVDQLLVSTSGRVSGVQVTNADDLRLEINARRAVVLCTGGFENAPGLCDSYLPVSPVHAISHPGNTGDGLRLAQSVGADVWHMNNFFGFWCLPVEGYAVAFGLGFTDPGHLIVGADGRRFAAETGREAHDRLRVLGDVLPSAPTYPQLPAFALLDERALQSAPISGFRSPNGYSWSSDNAAELAAGWIVGADSSEQLGPALGIDGGNLARTVAVFNAAAASGVDAAFGRSAATMRPLEGERIYGVRMWPGVATTSGGPRRDRWARVLGPNRAPIPGLYAAGGNGSVWRHLTQHGGGLTDALVFGRVAVEHALAH
jgi:succinate dehydrogenase/fumarate reductase flavoprotein subunit